MHRNQKRSRIQNQKTMTEYAKAAYLITFDDNIGPVIIAKSPPNPAMKYNDGELNSAVHVSSALDFENLIIQVYETGYTSWSSPNSIFYYIAFVKKNNKRRGNYELYILGVNVDKDLKNFLGDYHSQIEGYLHSKMNKLNNLINTLNIDLMNEEQLIFATHSPEANFNIHSILYELRRKMNHLIDTKLHL